MCNKHLTFRFRSCRQWNDFLKFVYTAYIFITCFMNYGIENWKSKSELKTWLKEFFFERKNFHSQSFRNLMTGNLRGSLACKIYKQLIMLGSNVYGSEWLYKWLYNHQSEIFSLVEVWVGIFTHKLFFLFAVLFFSDSILHSC
jgi:hypothetical protein